MNAKLLLGVILTISLFQAKGQGIYALETGTGQVTSYNSYHTPAFEASVVKMVLPHISVGAAVDWRFYSFVYSDPSVTYVDPNYGTLLTINHHSSYLFLSPIVDLSIGENQYIHLNFNIGPGIYLGGKENTLYETNALPGYPEFNNVNTSANNNKIVYQYSYGMSEYIPTKGFWSIKLSQQFGTLGRELNSNHNFAPVLSPGFFAFTVGIAHYYKPIYIKY